MVRIADIAEYKQNAKIHSKKQLKHLKESIKAFGFNDPIAIDENNVIIEGHGRLRAMKELGYDEIPCIRLKHLTEDEKRAYIIAHNKINMETGFDMPILENELLEIKFDMAKFDLSFDPSKTYKENQRYKTNDAYNLHLVDFENSTNNFWQMPILRKTDYVPDDLIGFNYAKTSKEKDCGIHFFIDDYQFERVWNSPEGYIDVLKQYQCVLTPDFSLYMDMPMPMKIWNTYRSRQIGKYWQDLGLTVIPCLSWAEKQTYIFAFEGVEAGGTIALSTVGVNNKKEAIEIWKSGCDEAIRRLKPKTILLYGGEIKGYDFKGVNVVRYQNHVTERMKMSPAKRQSEQ